MTEENKNITTIEEEEEEEEDNNGIEPVSDGRTITFKPKILNEFLTCTLCKGYFRDPMTVRECLHTFCKSCIYKYIVDNIGNFTCPECNIPFGSRPFEAIKEDCVIQELIIKIFPQVFDKDKDDEIRFNEYLEKTNNSPSDSESETGKRKYIENIDSPPSPKKQKLIHKIEIKLQYEDISNKSSLKSLSKPILTLPTHATMLHLKKFIKKDLSSDIPLDSIDILFNNEILGSEHTIEYVLKTRNDKSSARPTFSFKERIE